MASPTSTGGGSIGSPMNGGSIDSPVANGGSNVLEVEVAQKIAAQAAAQAAQAAAQKIAALETEKAAHEAQIAALEAAHEAQIAAREAQIAALKAQIAAQAAPSPPPATAAPPPATAAPPPATAPPATPRATPARKRAREEDPNAPPSRSTRRRRGASTSAPAPPRLTSQQLLERVETALRNAYNDPEYFAPRWQRNGRMSLAQASIFREADMRALARHTFVHLTAPCRSGKNFGIAIGVLEDLNEHGGVIVVMIDAHKAVQQAQATDLIGLLVGLGVPEEILVRVEDMKRQDVRARVQAALARRVTSDAAGVASTSTAAPVRDAPLVIFSRADKPQVKQLKVDGFDPSKLTSLWMDEFHDAISLAGKKESELVWMCLLGRGPRGERVATHPDPRLRFVSACMAESKEVLNKMGLDTSTMCVLEADPAKLTARGYYDVLHRGEFRRIQDKSFVTKNLSGMFMDLNDDPDGWRDSVWDHCVHHELRPLYEAQCTTPGSYLLDCGSTLQVYTNQAIHQRATVLLRQFPHVVCVFETGDGTSMHRATANGQPGAGWELRVGYAGVRSDAKYDSTPSLIVAAEFLGKLDAHSVVWLQSTVLMSGGRDYHVYENTHDVTVKIEAGGMALSITVPSGAVVARDPAATGAVLPARLRLRVAANGGGSELTAANARLIALPSRDQVIEVPAAVAAAHPKLRVVPLDPVAAADSDDESVIYAAADTGTALNPDELDALLAVEGVLRRTLAIGDGEWTSSRRRPSQVLSLVGANYSSQMELQALSRAASCGIDDDYHVTLVGPADVIDAAKASSIGQRELLARTPGQLETPLAVESKKFVRSRFGHQKMGMKNKFRGARFTSGLLRDDDDDVDAEDADLADFIVTDTQGGESSAPIWMKALQELYDAFGTEPFTYDMMNTLFWWKQRNYMGFKELKDKGHVTADEPFRITAEGVRVIHA